MTFFETTRLGRPDVDITSIWQQLAGLVRAPTSPLSPIAEVKSGPPSAVHQNHVQRHHEPNNGGDTLPPIDETDPRYDPEAGDLVVYDADTFNRRSGTSSEPPSRSADHRSDLADDTPNDFSPTSVSSRGRQRRVS